MRAGDAMPVQYEVSVHEHIVTVEFDAHYVEDRLTAKDLLSGKESSSIFPGERVAAAVRGALRRKYPAVKFRIWRHRGWEDAIVICWRSTDLDASKVEAIAIHAITTMCTVPERMMRPSSGGGKVTPSK
jgi:hypothetical protein